MTVALGDTGITEQYKYFVCHDHASCIMHHACFMILDMVCLKCVFVFWGRSTIQTFMARKLHINLFF